MNRHAIETLPRRLLRKASAIAAFTLLLAAVLASVTAWRAEGRRLEALAAQVERSLAVSLAESVWMVDIPQTESQLKSALSIDGIARVQLRTFTGQEYRHAVAVKHGELLVRTRKLEREGQPLGMLEIAVSRDALIDAVASHIAQVLVIVVNFLALFGAMLYVSIRREVTTPLARIATQVTLYEPTEAPAALPAHEFARLSREMSGLAEAFNNMQEEIRQRLHHERQLREQVARLASERGDALDYRTAVEQRLLAMSSSMISLPSGQIAAELRRHLAGISSEMRLDIIAVLEPARAGSTVGCRFLYPDSVRSATMEARDASPLAAWVDERVTSQSVVVHDDVSAASSPVSPLQGLWPRVVGAFVAVPLAVGDESHGLMVFTSGDGDRRWSESEIATLTMVGQIAASVMTRDDALRELARVQDRLEETNRELERLSRIDGLTGLSNRLAFDEQKDKEFSRARRAGDDMALLLIDIDHFKAINDTFGHIAGDQCLQSVAQALSKAARRGGDLLARIGGEEFALIVPGCTEEAARRCVDAIQREIAILALPHPMSAHVTVSVGVALLDKRHKAFEDLFLECDRALYTAKGSGRNRAEFATVAA